MRSALAATVLSVALLGIEMPRPQVVVAPEHPAAPTIAVELASAPRGGEPPQVAVPEGPSLAEALAPAPPPSQEPLREGPATPSGEEPEASIQAAATETSCSLPDPGPLPRPGDQAALGFWSSFRDPLPPAPLFNPPGPKRVGLQAGHWLTEQVPFELRRLEQGSSGGGKAEWEVNLDIAQRARELLESAGVDVDVLPATVPVGYRAHAFVSIHADGDTSGGLRGYKVAHPGFSSIPAADDRLVDALNDAYGDATGLPRDDAHISRRMVYYYAFNSRRYCHSVAPGVPQAIVETGFLTSAVDRQTLLGKPDLAAAGIARGVLAFLGVQP